MIPSVARLNNKIELDDALDSAANDRVRREEVAQDWEWECLLW